MDGQQEQLEQREQQAVEIIQLLVQHCSLEPSLLCSLLQVSAPVNQALRQCRGQCRITARVSTFDNRACRPSNFAGLAAWLPQHAGLVQALIIERDTYTPSDSSRLGDTDELCTQLLDTALQLATAPARQPPAAHAAPVLGPAIAAGHGSDRKALSLQLQEFASEYRISTPGLLALATCTGLRSASIQYRATYTSPAFLAAMGQLSGLQELSLQGGAGKNGPRIPDQLARLVCTFSSLTRLECDSLATRTAPLLPATLQHLDVTWEGEGGFLPLVADLSHLTALQHAGFDSFSSRQVALTVPASLTFLDVAGPVIVKDCTGLRSLHCSLTSAESDMSLSSLNVPSTLAQLEQLWVVGTQPLRGGLDVLNNRLEQVSSALMHLTALTGLVIDLHHADNRDTSAVPICKSLSSLRRLQSLVLHGPIGAPWHSCRYYHYHSSELCQFTPRGLLHLAALEQLTHLSLHVPALNDFCATSLLGKLTGLQHLQMSTGSIRTGGFLAVLPGLTGLTSLELDLESRAAACDCGWRNRRHRFRWDSDELMQLSALTRLQHLVVIPESQDMPDLFDSLNLPDYLPPGGRRGLDDWSDDFDSDDGGDALPRHPGQSD